MSPENKKHFFSLTRWREKHPNLKSLIRSNLSSRQWWMNWVNIVVGCFLLAAGYVLFITPYNIVPGGVYGAGIVLHYIFPDIQVGTFGLMFDVPLLLIAFWIFGGMFGTKTIVAALITPVMMNTMTYLIGEDPSLMFGGRIDLSNDIIIACIFGGIIIGVGVGLVIRARATTGGTDIVAMIVTKYFNLKFSQSVLIVDSMIVVFGIIVFGDWRLPLYSLITIYVITRAIDLVLEGASYDKLMFITTEYKKELSDFILNEMGRGASYIKSSGMYTGTDRDMIFLVISRREITAVQNKIKEIDPAAFVVVVNAHETFGDGFKPFPDKI